MKTYSVYKGLQKPLVFKGFKGKYMFYGAGSVIGGFIVFGISSKLIGSSALGGLSMVAFITAGFFYTVYKQKQGLHNKAKTKALFFVPSKLKRHVQKKADSL